MKTTSSAPIKVVIHEQPQVIPAIQLYLKMVTQATGQIFESHFAMELEGTKARVSIGDVDMVIINIDKVGAEEIAHTAITMGIDTVLISQKFHKEAEASFEARNTKMVLAPSYGKIITDVIKLLGLKVSEGEQLAMAS
jgi:hypothetical protein